MSLLAIPFLFVLALVLVSVGSGLYLTVQWIAWYRQGRQHKAWSYPLAMGWLLLLAGTFSVWQFWNGSSLEWQSALIVIVSLSTALLIFPYAFIRYRETLVALAASPRYDDPQEGVWPPPPTHTV